MVNMSEIPQYIPLDIGRIASLPGRKLLGLFLEVENKPGVLAKISRVIADMHINILHVTITTPVREVKPTVPVLMFVDITNSIASVEDIVESLSSLDVVRKIQVSKPIWDGVLADEYHFPIVVDEVRAIIMTLPVLEGLIAVIQRHEGLRALLWYQGLEVGIRVTKMYRTLYGVKTLRDLLKLFQVRALSMGWARLEIVRVDEVTGIVVLRMYDNWECSIIKSWGPRDKPQNTFIRGLIAGILKEFYGVDYEVIETKCIAKGDPYCEFHARPRTPKVMTK